MIQLHGPLPVAQPIRMEAPAISATSWLEIDLGRLEHNVATLKSRLAPDGRVAPKMCVAIKKDAYGLGAAPIAHRLVKAGCDMLAVFSADEARELVKNAITCPLLVLMPLSELSRTDLLYRHAVAERLHLTIHSVEQLAAVNQIGRTFGIRFPVHLHLDTGMSRGGLSEAQADTILQNFGDHSHARLAGLMTHFASAATDPGFTREQAGRLQALAERHKAAVPNDCVLHVANTFALLREPALHLDMVRPGLGVFGYGPELLPESDAAALPPLSPIVRWLSGIMHVQRYTAGSPIGYGATHQLLEDAVLGVVPVGYGDGYPQNLSNLASVRVTTETPKGAVTADCRVLGRVNMDQITIDLSPLAVDASDLDFLKTAQVEVYSNDPSAPNSLSQLAASSGNSVYELLCRMSPQLKRHYVNHRKA